LRFILLALLPLLAIFLQSTLFASYSIKGVVPDMVLVFVIFYALLNGAEKGARYGLICGLLEDLYTGRFIGMNALSSLLNACLFFILAFAYFAVFNIDRSLFINIIYQSFYNVVITTPIYLWYYQSSKRGLLKETGER